MAPPTTEQRRLTEIEQRLLAVEEKAERFDRIAHTLAAADPHRTRALREALAAIGDIVAGAPAPKPAPAASVSVASPPAPTIPANAASPAAGIQA